VEIGLWLYENLVLTEEDSWTLGPKDSSAEPNDDITTMTRTVTTHAMVTSNTATSNEATGRALRSASQTSTRAAKKENDAEPAPVLAKIDHPDAIFQVTSVNLKFFYVNLSMNCKHNGNSKFDCAGLG
jgi:hypothetical protein